MWPTQCIFKFPVISGAPLPSSLVRNLSAEPSKMSCHVFPELTTVFCHVSCALVCMRYVAFAGRTFDKHWPSCSGWRWGNMRSLSPRMEEPRLWCHRLHLFNNTLPIILHSRSDQRELRERWLTHLVSPLWSPGLPDLPGSWLQRDQPELCKDFNELYFDLCSLGHSINITSGLILT